LNPTKHVQSILSKRSSKGVRWTEGEVPPHFISQWNKAAEVQKAEGKLREFKNWEPPVIFRLVLVSADFSWGEVEQLSKDLSDATGFLQNPKGCGTRKGMLLYNPQFFRMPDEVLWEVLGEDPVSTENDQVL
jgi:hypothetical protein